MTRKHSHYYKDVKYLDEIDIYRVLGLFNVTNPCIQHAVKKLLVAGGRGAGKDIDKDIDEAINSLVRWQEMRSEDDFSLSMASMIVHNSLETSLETVEAEIQEEPQPNPKLKPVPFGFVITPNDELTP